jgi:hypothetical protein
MPTRHDLFADDFRVPTPTPKSFIFPQPPKPAVRDKHEPLAHTKHIPPLPRVNEVDLLHNLAAELSARHNHDGRLSKRERAQRDALIGHAHEHHSHKPAWDQEADRKLVEQHQVEVQTKRILKARERRHPLPHDHARQTSETISRLARPGALMDAMAVALTPQLRRVRKHFDKHGAPKPVILDADRPPLGPNYDTKTPAAPPTPLNAFPDPPAPHDVLAWLEERRVAREARRVARGNPGELSHNNLTMHARMVHPWK